MKKIVLILVVVSAIIAGSVLIGGFLSSDDKQTNSSSSSTQQTNNTTTASPQSQATPGQTYTLAQVAEKSSPDDCWIIISGNVYDVTDYLTEHPGGADRITPFCGKDATQAFATRGGDGTHSSTAQSIKDNYLVGSLAN